ncbi:MAG: zinc ribbon domain-containing protein [Bdellovibrionales bacterium]|nr:zinc ribbon domain-containing protein [Bdellovibrionales bacterium]
MKILTRQITSSTACSQCHETIESQHKFCPHCGYKIAA